MKSALSFALFFVSKCADHHYEECPEQAFFLSREDGEVPVTVGQAGGLLSVEISQALCHRYEEVLGAVRQLPQCVGQLNCSNTL